MTINNNQRASAPNAPYTYKTGINDTVSLNNGSLRHEEKIAYLPGRNSLDLDLTMVYNAAESDSLMGGDELSPWPVKSLGHGWSMNFTRQLRMGDLTYFRFTDGSTYQYANGVLQNYKLSDITVTNNNGALTLNYADGRKEAFDANGNLTSITDRFGNRISLQYYPETKTATGPTTIWLKPDGTVWACGNNDYGQLGDGTTTSRSTMVQVSDLTNIVAVAASPFHSVALKSDGTVWTWGRNDYGQLGNGTSANQSIPAQIKGLTDITSVTAGEYNTFALQSDGTVWAWGNNNYGILGDGLTLNQATPVQIKALTGILAIAAGEAHTAALKPDGTIWAWGLNDHGQLGDGTTIDRTTPVQVSGLTGATDIAVGAHRTIALKSDGTVWAWGQDNHCEQCHDTANSKLTPVQVRELKDVVAIAAAFHHNVALKTDGTVWTWGCNCHGQLGDGRNKHHSTPCGPRFPGSSDLGHGTTKHHSTPVKVRELTGVVAVFAGRENAGALKADGSICLWGDNSFGQLGDGTTAAKDLPVCLPYYPVQHPDKKIATGVSTIWIKADGTVWSCGNNPFGQLGDGTTTDKSTPVQVIGLTGMTVVAAGTFHTVSLKSDGTVFAWGYNTYGQLGDGTTIGKITPVQVSGLRDVADVAVGDNFTVFLKSDGTVWACGVNDYGQLGDETITSRFTPVRVSGLTGVVSIAAGLYHAVALKSDGTVWAWGNSSYGSLGDDTTINQTSPMQVNGLADIVAIAAGEYSTFALKSDGTVWAFGFNAHGQLGDGTTTSRSAFAQVSGLTGVVSIVSGANHTLALKSDGTVWSWGQNNAGQLGDGTTKNMSTPVQVSGLTDVTSIAAGRSNSAALKSDGTGWVWGANDYGQLGDGTTVEKSLPILLDIDIPQTTPGTNSGASSSLLLTDAILISDSLGKLTQIQYDRYQQCYRIILPDYTQTTFYLDQTTNLVSKKDALGRVASYSYALNQGYHTLTGITYCTGLQSAFTYNYSTGDVPGLRLTNMVCTDNGSNYLSENYTYAYDQTSVTYTTTITNALGVATAHLFDGYTDLKQTETVTDNGSIKSQISYTYGDLALPIQITSTVYNSAGNSRTAEQLYEYDSKGNLTAYYGPLAQGVKTAVYGVFYTYDPKYNLLAGKTYYKDSNTSVTEKYTLTTDLKAVSAAEVYENDVLKAKAAYVYDQYGNVIVEKDYSNETDYIRIKYCYAHGGDLISKTVGARATVKAAYDLCGRVIAVTDAKNHTEKYTRDLLGRITKVTHVDGNGIRYLYQDSANSTEVTNERGYTTKYLFDGFGNLKQIIDLSCNVTLATYSYDTLLRLTEQTDALGNPTQYSYDHLGRLIQKTAGGSYTESYSYNDAYTNPGEKIATLARVTKTIVGDNSAPSIMIFMDTDNLGNLVQAGRLDGQTAYTDTFSYNYLGHRISELSAKDQANNYTYTNQYTTDLFGNVLTLTKDTGVVYQYAYDLLSRITRATDAKKNSTFYHYDQYGNLASKQVPFTKTAHRMETYFYDLNGNPTLRTVTSGLAEEEGTKRIIDSGLPGEYTKKIISSGWPEECTDQERRTEFVYDDRDRLVKTIAYDYDNSPYYTSYVYDTVGNVIRLVTGNGKKVATYAYDHRNRLTTETDPLGHSRTYIYDHNNNLLETIDRNGNKTVNQYNSLNQLTQSTVTMPNGTSQTNHYSYLATGAMGTSANEHLTTSYQYDNFGRVIKKSNSNGTELNYSYDLADNLILNQLTVNGNLEQAANYSYDKQNRLHAIFDNGQTTTAAAVYAYDANGNRIAKHNQYNAHSSTYRYNRANLLVDLHNKKGAELISQYQYSYYLDGNQASKTENRVKTEYIYDGLGQLVIEKEAGAGAKQYSYDQSGNRVKMDVSGAEKYTTVYSYDGNNRLTKAETDRAGQDTILTAYSYDPNGNQIAQTTSSVHGITVSREAEQPGSMFIGAPTDQPPASLELRHYDGRNRVTSYTAPGIQAHYTYQANGLRLAQTVDGYTTTHIWDGQNMIAELQPNGVVNTYLWGYDLAASQRNGQPKHYYLYNGRGDVTALANQAGTITKRYHYDAFGVQQNQDYGDRNPFRYAGQYYDLHTGTYYLRARSYNPRTGRFLSEDPMQNGGNYYAYCHNDPVNFIDPSGMIDTLLYTDPSGATVTLYPVTQYAQEHYLNVKVNWDNTNKKATYSCPSYDPVTFAKGEWLVDQKGVIFAPNSTLVTKFSQWVKSAGIKTSSSKGTVWIEGGTFTLDAFGSGTFTGVLAFDNKGNVGIVEMGSAGFGYNGASIGTCDGVLDLDDIYDLKNVTVTTTLSGGIAGGVLGETVVFKDTKFVGTINNISLGTPGVDVNVQKSNYFKIVDPQKVDKLTTDALILEFYLRRIETFGL